MSNTLVNLVVSALIIGTIALLIFMILAKRKQQSASQVNEKKFMDWMAHQNFSPDHYAWFGGTGMALKRGDDRILLQSRGNIQFYPLADITDAKTFQTTATARPLGAAPGVVETREFKLFNLELHFKNDSIPVRILLKDEDALQKWEQLLKPASQNE